MKTRAVNVRAEKCDIYCGRGSYRGMSSDWGNPFTHADGTLARYRVENRMESIRSHRQWLFGHAPEEGRPQQLGQYRLLFRLSELKGKRLGCWCVPLDCHCQTLARLADGVKESSMSEWCSAGTPAGSTFRIRPDVAQAALTAIREAYKSSDLQPWKQTGLPLTLDQAFSFLGWIREADRIELRAEGVMSGYVANSLTTVLFYVVAPYVEAGSIVGTTWAEEYQTWTFDGRHVIYTIKEVAE